jgi:hypothetical protein
LEALLVLEADAPPSESPCLLWVDLTPLAPARPPVRAGSQSTRGGAAAVRQSAYIVR